MMSCSDFLSENRDVIKNIEAEMLVPVNMNPEWHFVFGKPVDGWMDSMQEGKIFRMQKNTFDFDRVLDKEVNPEDGLEGVVYQEFEAESEGIAEIGVGCDWWFSAYCNGKRCFSTWQSGNKEGQFAVDNNPFFIPVCQGKNLLAIRVKRGSGSWHFCCGVIPFTKIPLPILQYGPFCNNPDIHKMGIRFMTCGKIGAGVKYRLKGADAWRMQWDQRHGQILREEFHSIFLDGLESGKEYEYRVVMMDPRSPEMHVVSPEKKCFSFSVPPEKDENFSFFFTADLQFPPKEHMKYLQAMLKAADAKKCNMIVFGGDAFSSFLSEDIFRCTFKTLQTECKNTIPIVFLRGNHELRGDHADQFLKYFGNDNGVSYGIFRFGETAFLVLDCWEDKPADSPNADYCKYNLDEIFYDEERKFLKQAVNSAVWKDAKRRIVLAHGAPYSQYDACETMPFVLQDLTDCYFAGKQPKSRLDLWLAGHSHHYTRSIPGTAILAAPDHPDKPQKDGTDYIYPVLTVGGPSETQKIKASAFRVDSTDEKLLIKAYDQDGKCFEEVAYFDDGRVNEIRSLPHRTFDE
ncbi:MAG: metallophosphoesterase [Lentisphaeria bacterium]